MKEFKFTDEDKNLIASAIKAGGKIWENDIIKPVKDKIKEYHREIQDEACCYCKRDTKGEFKFVLDIEHILPKHRPEFKQYMFTICNLSVSCKRCNMQIKGQKVDFITEIDKAKSNPCDSDLYKFIHPNLDNYYDHLHYIVEIVDNLRIIKYSVNDDSEKGKFTYDYFKLSQLERESYNKVQGVKDEEISEQIDDEIAKEIRELLKTSS